MAPAYPAVFDCNVFLQAMLSTRGSAHACWQAVLAGEVKLYVSPFILAEVRQLPDHPKLRRFPQLTNDRVERFIEGIMDAANLVADPPHVFLYPRDPDDASYVDLALSTGAMLIVTHDKDLLDLMSDSNAEGRALRTAHSTFQVLTPPQLLLLITPGMQTEGGKAFP